MFTITSENDASIAVNPLRSFLMDVRRPETTCVRVHYAVCTDFPGAGLMKVTLISDYPPPINLISDAISQLQRHCLVSARGFSLGNVESKVARGNEGNES